MYLQELFVNWQICPSYEITWFYLVFGGGGILFFLYILISVLRLDILVSQFGTETEIFTGRGGKTTLQIYPWRPLKCYW